MAVGANIKMGSRKQTVQKLMTLLQMRAHGLSGASHGNIGYKAGVPANNTAADNPPRIGFLLVDVTNSHVYICTAWTTDASATTWVQIA